MLEQFTHNVLKAISTLRTVTKGFIKHVCTHIYVFLEFISRFNCELSNISRLYIHARSQARPACQVVIHNIGARYQQHIQSGLTDVHVVQYWPLSHRGRLVVLYSTMSYIQYF